VEKTEGSGRETGLALNYSPFKVAGGARETKAILLEKIIICKTEC